MTDFLPRVIPFGWRIAAKKDDGAAYVHDGLMLSVILSAAVEQDGKKWLHVSCAHPHKLPSWETLKEIKDLFIGRDRQAIQVLPSEKNYVNIHKFCLHLFCCLNDADPVPDFTHGGKTL